MSHTPALPGGSIFNAKPGSIFGANQQRLDQHCSGVVSPRRQRAAEGNNGSCSGPDIAAQIPPAPQPSPVAGSGHGSRRVTGTGRSGTSRAAGADLGTWDLSGVRGGAFGDGGGRVGAGWGGSGGGPGAAALTGPVPGNYLLKINPRVPIEILYAVTPAPAPADAGH